jgi:hypothetical protein
VEGEGDAEFIMDGFTPATAREHDDSAGVDRFTAIAFVGVTGGGVRGVRFVGQADGTPLQIPPDSTPFVFASRAKAVGITNSTDVAVRDVAGRGIVGNVVNARGDAAPYATRRISVTGCYAEGCSENGFNYMGGTADCVFSDNISIGNVYSGFESGTFGLTCTGNVCRANQVHGINHVGTHGTFADNVLADNAKAGFAFQYQAEGPKYGDQNVLSGNVIAGNVEMGITAEAGTRDNLVTGNRLLNNGSAAGAQGILLIGSSSTSGTSGYVVSGNFIEETRGGTSTNIGGVIANHATTLNVTGNTFRATGGHSVRATGGSSHVYSGNVANRTASVTGTTGVTSTGNVGF